MSYENNNIFNIPFQILTRTSWDSNSLVRLGMGIRYLHASHYVVWIMNHTHAHTI